MVLPTLRGPPESPCRVSQKKKECRKESYLSHFCSIAIVWDLRCKIPGCRCKHRSWVHCCSCYPIDCYTGCQKWWVSKELPAVFLVRRSFLKEPFSLTFPLQIFHHEKLSATWSILSGDVVSSIEQSTLTHHKCVPSRWWLRFRPDC